MRVGEIDPRLLCNTHLQYEHSRLHAIRSRTTSGRYAGETGWPESKWWRDRHELVVGEVRARQLSSAGCPPSYQPWLNLQPQPIYLFEVARGQARKCAACAELMRLQPYYMPGLATG